MRIKCTKRNRRLVGRGGCLPDTGARSMEKWYVFESHTRFLFQSLLEWRGVTVTVESGVGITVFV